MARVSGTQSMTVNAHVDEHTRITHKLYDGTSPWVTLEVGNGLDQVTLFVRDLGSLAAIADTVVKAHQDLAGELGFLPNGEPCVLVDDFGSIEWTEHDHDQCLESLVDEPVPYLPTEMAGVLGSVA